MRKFSCVRQGSSSMPAPARAKGDGGPMKHLADEAPSILWRSAKDSAKAGARQASAAVRDVGEAVKVGGVRSCEEDVYARVCVPA